MRGTHASRLNSFRPSRTRSSAANSRVCPRDRELFALLTAGAKRWLTTKGRANVARKRKLSSTLSAWLKYGSLRDVRCSVLAQALGLSLRELDTLNHELGG